MIAIDLKEALIPLIDSQIPTFIWGSPGVGKSSLVAQIAQEKEMKFIDLRLSLLDPTDLRGIPFFDYDKDLDEKKAVWAKPEFLPDSSSLDYGVLFLDEINSAPPTIQAAAYQLILDRKIGEYILPKNYAIIAAGNYESDRGVTYRMPTPLANRFVHLDFDLDFESWKLWAFENSIDRRVLSYLSYKPDDLFMFDPKSKEKSFATPRSWKFVDDILKSNIPTQHLENVISGAIGKNSAIEFLNYCKVIDELPDISKILEGKSVDIPTKNSALYAMCIGIVYKLQDDFTTQNLSNVLEFSLTLDGEFTVMLIRDIQKNGIDVEASNKWKEWVDANRFLIS
ncbi:MAG: MoxR family ATPase [Campylobacterota bacterium]|nr:MoxR family ATPase [Campylobacterota bacterium]